MRKINVVVLMMLWAGLISSGNISAATIDFETIPGGTPLDGLSISTQFLASNGVSFSLENGGSPVLAQVGAPRTAFEGFDLLPDQPAPGTNAGQFFLTDDGVVGAPPSPLLIDYSSPVSAASGIILDIDGTEEWTIEALDSTGGLLSSLILGPNNTLDGSATVWSFDLGSAAIERIRFQYTGAQNVVGLAFDNFSPSSAVVPIPPAAWLFGSGLLGLVGIVA
jgi:hypothetical protein